MLASPKQGELAGHFVQSHAMRNPRRGVDHTLLGWCKDNPQLFASFEDVKDPENNLYIFHPKAARTSFVTPRSLEAASDWLKLRDGTPMANVFLSVSHMLGMNDFKSFGDSTAAFDLNTVPAATSAAE